MWTSTFGCSDLFGPNIYRLAQESEIFSRKKRDVSVHSPTMISCSRRQNPFTRIFLGMVSVSVVCATWHELLQKKGFRKSLRKLHDIRVMKMKWPDQTVLTVNWWLTERDISKTNKYLLIQNIFFFFNYDFLSYIRTKYWTAIEMARRCNSGWFTFFFTRPRFFSYLEVSMEVALRRADFPGLASGLIIHQDDFPVPSFCTRMNRLCNDKLWRIEFWNREYIQIVELVGLTGMFSQWVGLNKKSRVAADIEKSE